MATGNTTLQLTADPQFRGRVMALWSVTFTGRTPIGGPIAGVVADARRSCTAPPARTAPTEPDGTPGKP